jgi:hypothetical protein
MAQQKSSTCTCIVTMLLLVGAGVGVGLYFGLFTKEDIAGLGDAFGDVFDDILNSDPFAGLGGSSGGNGTAYTWKSSNGKGGLDLELLNALDDDWKEFFDEAVSDWNSGTPDALTLSTSRVAAESVCEPVNGKMKVCNGDYGATGWRGINELILTGDRIVNSVAKMNEFYLVGSTSSNEKQYTMCHEIGHGFGLPHTDENFYNKALGDCLDYTNDPSPNLRPGQINYDKLADLYGVVGERRHLTRQQRQVSTAAANTPDWVTTTFREKVQHFALGVAHNEDWVLLHQSPVGEIHTIDLGGGYRGHVNILLA